MATSTVEARITQGTEATAAIDATLAKVMQMDADQFAGPEAREVAAAHLRELGALESIQDREHAVAAIGAIAELSQDYRQYMVTHSRGTMASAELARADFMSIVDQQVGAWAPIESVPEASMRANTTLGTVEVHEQGVTTALPTLAAIQQWCNAHGVNVADKERLTTLGVEAWLTHASHRASPSQPSHEGLPAAMDSTQDNPRDPIVQIGSNMPKADWQEAINLLKAQSPGTRGHVYLPKAEGEYGGRVLLITDSHVVQRVGRGVAVAHDLGKLDNGAEITGAIDAGTVKPGTHLKVQYGPERGQATVIPFNQQRAEEMLKDLTAWAEKSITNSKGREAFLKHLTAAAHDMSQPRSEPSRQAAAAQRPERTHAPQRHR